SGGNRHRQAISQRLTLNGSPVEDSSTVVYLRYSGATDGLGGLMEYGATSLGMIVRTDSPNSVLEVELLRDNDFSATNTAVAVEAGRTGLAILKLPAYGDYLSLSGPAQNINFAQGNPETALSLAGGLPVSSPSFSHDPAVSASQVTVNLAGDYLFLASHFIDNFDSPGNNLRSITRQGFQTTPSGGAAGKISYGNGGAYNRDDTAGGERARDSGDWAGAILPLGAGDLVETTTARFGGNPASLTANTVGLQALNIGSISSPPLDPQISFSGPFNVLVDSSGNVITDEIHLQTSDANTGPEELIYTITSTIAGGTLGLGGAPLGEGATFTQEDVNNDLLTFDAEGSEQIGGFDFSVSDGGARPDAGTFVINVGITTALSDDSGETDEDTDLFLLGAGADSLLANDVGTALTVVSHDAVSEQGAAVTVAQDGTFTYDPGVSAPLQALAVGEQAIDSFTYTVADFQGNSSVATVSIQVAGVNDDPQSANESITSVNGSGATLNLLKNESDTDVSDVLSISNASQQIFGGGGAVSDDIFNFELVPLVFTSQFGATVSVSADGTFDYDVSTSSILLSLSPGVTLSETFEYEIFDGTSTVAALVTITSGGASLPTLDYASTDAGNTTNLDVLSNDSVGGAAGTPSPGAALDLNAGDAGNTDANWGNGGSGGGALVMEGAGTASVLITPENAPVGITAAYDLSGSGSGDQILSPDDANNLYGGNITTGSYSVEVVLRPDDHVGPEPIWGAGGNGSGSSLVLIDDQLIFTIGNNAQVAQAVATIPQNAIAGGDYVQVIGTFDIVTDVASLYVDGILVSQGGAINITTGGAGNVVDWAGTDDEGIGRSAGTTGGDVNVAPFLGAFGTTDIPDFNDANDRYDGELAIVRVYASVLTAAQINANYEAVYGAGVPAGIADITDLAGSSPPVVGDAVVLASGATVTLEADGTITYDPNGAFGYVGVGLSARDTFTYSLDTNTNSTVTVNVDVEGSNPDPQVAISADQVEIDEGGSATFSLSSSAAVSGAVSVNLSFSGLSGEGADFSAAATVEIPDGGNSAQVTIDALADNLYEGLENVIVTIESVDGNAVVGVPASAETLLNDGDSEPVFSVAADQVNGVEGTSFQFTVSPDVASQADRSVTLSYSGSAVNGQDFFGETSLVIPGGDASGSVSFIPFDDGIAEGVETLTITLESVDTGAVGEDSSATSEVADGAGALLFFADFENVDPFGDPGTPNGTKVGSDAPFAANLGTAVGSWEDVPVANVSGDLPGIYLEIDDAKGDGVDEALVLDRPVPGSGEIKARLAAPADISGNNAAFISMDLGNRRTQNGTEVKSWRIIGLDDAGEKSFELYVSGNNTAPNNERLHHVDSAGELTPLGQAADFDNTGSIEEETEQSRLILSLTSGGYRVAIDRWPMDGVIDSTSGVLPYAGEASQVSAILFSLSASLVDAESSGIIVDDLTVGGIAGNGAPAATLAGEGLPDGGSTSLPATFLATGTNIDGLQVEDVDAGEGQLTATFQSAGQAPLTFTAGGPAAVGGSGTDTLTLVGTLGEINASLATGVTSTTDGVIGGDAVISFTIDDGGNTGPGGPKSMTHDLAFFVNEGPTVTINQSAGQDDPTGDSPVTFEIVFSEAVTGFEAEDIDLSASTDAGPLSASVSGAGDTYTVSVTGMTSGGLVVISVAQGAANAAEGGAETEGSLAIDDSVLYIPQLAPSATNLVQDIEYEVGPVDLGDIVVTDPNDSVVTTGQVAQYDYPANHEDSLALVPDPDRDAGFAIDVAFQPSGFDDFGTVRVAEIGGTSNGTGIYLIDGIPHFVSKMNSVAADLPSGLNDTDWADGNVCVPLAEVALNLDEPAQVAVVSSLDTLTYSVNGFGQTTVQLTNRGTRWNWSGDDSIRVGQNTDGGRGGLGTDAEGIFDDTGSFPMEGTVSYARLWHAADAAPFSILAASTPEEITATLSLTPGQGDLTEPTGAVYDSATGVWTITGAVREVNAALAAVQFLPNGSSPVSIDVVLDDGDEDGSGPLTG
ncbi:MAG: VCBS domain-containing protein, partial [Verrucomicrobiota bacterium]|nr:VCBS domain-containing protein [Verrucomicrobiota bacterium]